MKVSMVMTVHNGEEYLQEAIDGITAQTYSDLEVIIVNNCSSDDTGMILSNIRDSRIKVISLDVDYGAANGLNEGIARVEGTWIAIHDADDISLPYRIEEQVAHIGNNPQLIAAGSFIECIAGNNLTPSMLAYMKNVERYKNSIITSEQMREDLLKGCPYTHGSLIISKEALLKAGGYNPKYRIAYDYDLLARLSAIGPIENVPKVLYKYRISPNSLSNLNVRKTSDEFLLAASGFIRKHCFGHKAYAPSVIIAGTEEGCKVFTGLMAAEKNMRIKSAITDFQEQSLIRGYLDYKKGKADAVIILTDDPAENGFVKLLLEKGLRQNRDFFTLWSAL